MEQAPKGGREGCREKDRGRVGKTLPVQPLAVFKCNSQSMHVLLYIV